MANYLLGYMILKNFDNGKIKNILINFTIIMIPLIIISIVFTFGKTLNVSSLGMTTFWGITTLYIYNILFTKSILEIIKNKTERTDKINAKK